MYKCSPLLCAAAAAIREGILGLIRSPINVKDKRALLSLLLFGAVYSSAGLSAEEQKQIPVANKENFHIYLLIGQSNMAGRGKIPEEATGDIENCFLLNDQAEWSPASNPLNRHSTVRKGLEMQ